MMRVETDKFALKKLSVFLFVSLIVLLSPALSHAQFSDTSVKFDTSEVRTQDEGTLETYDFTTQTNAPLTYELSLEASRVQDVYDYSGMAVYLGMAPAVKVMESGHVKTIKIKKNAPVLSDGEWTGFKGRFKAVLLRSEAGTVTITNDVMTVDWPVGVVPDLKILRGRQDTEMAPNIEGLVDIRTVQYAHLPRWMRVLCRVVEGIYKTIQSVTGLGWALSLLIFAIVIKLLLFPIAMLTARFQSQANAHKTALEPIFDNIKKNYKGETAHKKTMAAYKERGITPYYSLKPLLATMISLPVLIAIFNMLGEVEPLRGTSAFWIGSLAYPDAISTLPTKLPLFGESLNLLPFIMAGVTFFSAYTLKSSTASLREIGRQKRNLFLMGTTFFLIFYPFPSAMVLYWTLSTMLQLIANKFIKNT